MLPNPENPAEDARPAPKVISGGGLMCYVTDRNALKSSLGGGKAESRLGEKIRAAAGAGIDWVQIREKDLPAQTLLGLAAEAVRAAGPGPTKIIVNDRLDVALAASAAGVHLGRESVPWQEVVRWCRAGNAPREFLIGASCHSSSEAREAENAGVSYVIFGPVFDTPSKRVFGQPVGIAELAKVCAGVKIPVLAIGGIDVRNARDCFGSGAAGIAAIRMFQDADSLNQLQKMSDSLRNDFRISIRR